MEACYRSLAEEQWQERIDAAWEIMRSPCRVCPRYCKVDRTDRESPRVGFCRVKDRARVYSFGSHHGEESCLSGRRGSGTVFFSSCNLACVYCQNWQISQLRLGDEVSDEELAAMMLELQDRGCHNVNLVTPSICTPQIVKAAHVAARKGLEIPFVYNTSAYDSPESLRIMDGIIDIYMPDTKYSSNAVGRRLSLVTDYWTVAQSAIKEMHRQVGELVITGGLAKRGLLVRHLVLPGGLAGTREVMRFLAQEVSRDTYVNIMAQYLPEHKAGSHPPLDRPAQIDEVAEAYEMAREEGLHRFDERMPLAGGRRPGP